MYEEIVARAAKSVPEQALRSIFKEHINREMSADALFIDTSFERIIGVGNLPTKVPVVLALLKNSKVAGFLLKEVNGSILIINKGIGVVIKINKKKGAIEEITVPSEISTAISDIITDSFKWAGVLNENGEHSVDLCSPSPGPHFNVNLLMGNRIGYAHALQTTPKSVVDRLGRGSFRSHASTQVLATKWDLRQEENGFPANRQFYLVENCKKIFFSAEPGDSNIESAVCIHSQNYTTIRYKTKCGLEIERVIFILPQRDEMPLATEVQHISIRNSGSQTRKLKLVYTGMFGSAAPQTVFEDVLYNNIISQAKILRNVDGTIAAVGPDYYPEYAQGDLRFHTMMIQKSNQVIFPSEFCMNYNEFVGNGTLEEPDGLYHLSNSFYRKGPGFFAVAGEFELSSGEECTVPNFTGLVSKIGNPDFNESTFKTEIGNLISKFSKPHEVKKELDNIREFHKSYSSFLQVQTQDDRFDSYFNKNLPFQVLYQTFVSRSFCQTQKGYREIGFREIQDIYASMYFFVGMGMSDFVKQLLKEWCSKVFEFGFAYHNFFWEGKEPGKWSDDALWFIQAVYRFINLSGDIGFLDEECGIAGTDPIKTRPVYETIKAILKYSGEISIGKHCLPLLDYADWNDTLKLDNDSIDGITKEILYKKQISNSGLTGEAFISDYSESVMNAFLLKVAIDEMICLAGEKNDNAYKSKLESISEELFSNLQKHAWKANFFARVLFNRYKENEYNFLGAKGDNLSADPSIDGSYFLNSFSWAIISNSASDEQIRIMFNSIEAVLKTPYGIKLCSPADLEKIATGTATGQYYPGDRENGGVFKHACMMATAAMFKAAKEIKDAELAERLSGFAYWMLDLVLPYKTLEDPFVNCGNPRFCTQYNNSETGENIGPMLSGTSTWLTLTLMSAFGVEYTRHGIIINPILREGQEVLSFSLNTGKPVYKIIVRKPKGFFRIKDSNVYMELDGKPHEGNMIPLFDDSSEHTVTLSLD